MNLNNHSELQDLLENPEIFNINRLPATSDHRYYATVEEAVRQDAMGWRKCLNGRWQIHYSDVLEGRPVGFESLDFDTKDFDYINVPGHIQLQGFDIPHYVNTQYPWDGHEDIKPPNLPTRFNPTASYVKEFAVPSDWKQGVFVSFQGVESAFNLWCNGKYVGYSEDSFTPSNFDVTPYINRKGNNKLAVQVYKYSSGSWLEDQDFWRLSGIFRDVYLYTKPSVHIEDFFVKTPLNETYDHAQVTVEIKLLNGKESTMEFQLFDQEEKEVASSTSNEASHPRFVTLNVPKPHLWSAEKPYLYTLQMKVIQSGNLVEVVRYPVGIREFKLINGLMCINGQRIVFRGVNRHDFSATRGRSVTKAEMEWDVKFLKAYNFNAVRTSHYPNDSYFYELCDRFGLYVIDEANLETHGTWHPPTQNVPLEHTLPGCKPEWLGSVIDRAQSMLERDKNHPSIVIWSCGNESFGGENLYKMSEYFRNRDETRLVHYEGLFWDRRYNDTSCMESQMYTTAKHVEKWLEENPKKPFILCEYSHAMANSCGGLDRYIALEDKYDRYQGGFIWDYIDQVIESKDRYGQSFLAYGGDFGDRPTDYNFCTNGIVSAKRKPSTKALAVKGAYAPVVLQVESNVVKLKNKHLFTNLNEYDLKWQMEVDERIVAADVFSVSLEPLASKKITLDLPNVTYDKELVLTVSVHLREETAYAKKGHEIAFGQYINRKENIHQQGDVQPFIVANGDFNVSIKGQNFHVMFCRRRGRIVSLKYGANEYIYHPDLSLMPSFWRAPIDNDIGHDAPYRMAQWKIASLYAKHDEMIIKELEDGLHIAYRYSLPTTPVAYVWVSYFVNHLGEINIEMTYEGTEGLPNMFKFGLDLAIPADFDRLTWRGFGPDETYADRAFGSKYGTFTNFVKDNVPEYVRPQACGNHIGVIFAKITKENGEGLEIVATQNQSLSFSALPYTAHELEYAQRVFELPPVHKTVLSVNLKEMGVGGDNSWGARPDETFDLPAHQPYQLTFKIKPVK